MADFIRGAANFAFGVNRTGSTKERDRADKEKEKERLQASPSNGSDADNNADLAVEDFDPFTPAETDDIDGQDGANIVALVAPPEKE